MEIELKRTKIKAKIYDKEVTLLKPTVKQYEAFSKNISENMSEGSALTYMRSYLAVCGMPQEVMDELEMEHLSELIQMLSGAKKK